MVEKMNSQYHGQREQKTEKINSQYLDRKGKKTLRKQTVNIMAKKNTRLEDKQSIS